VFGELDRGRRDTDDNYDAPGYRLAGRSDPRRRVARLHGLTKQGLTASTYDGP
jgi:hypothetical protein